MFIIGGFAIGVTLFPIFPAINLIGYFMFLELDEAEDWPLWLPVMPDVKRPLE